jgi:hypothetical protein
MSYLYYLCLNIFFLKSNKPKIHFNPDYKLDGNVVYNEGIIIEHTIPLTIPNRFVHNLCSVYYLV